MTSTGQQSGLHWRRSLFSGPHDLNWGIAWAFIIGASLFALGSFPLYSQRVDPGVVGITFVIGSLFFTSGGYGVFVEVVNDTNTNDAGVAEAGRRRYVGWLPQSAAWWAASIQLVGTLLFNVNTFAAMIDGLSTEQTNRLVWAPDIFGSAAFLISSHLTWIGLRYGIRHKVWSVRRASVTWWSAALNYVGSVFFGISTIAALTLPTTGEELNTTFVNAGTFLGALCFVFGAYLLLPDERTSRPPSRR